GRGSVATATVARAACAARAVADRPAHGARHRCGRADRHRRVDTRRLEQAHDPRARDAEDAVDRNTYACASPRRRETVCDGCARSVLASGAHRIGERTDRLPGDARAGTEATLRRASLVAHAR